MELRHLRYVLAVADEGSFTRAASMLRVAQQALSHQVADLEREVGVQIFHRLPRGIRPTAAGAAFLADARTIVAKSAHAVSEANRVARAGAARIRVGSSPASVPALERLITHLRRTHPAVGIELELPLSREHERAVQQGRLDIALSFEPPGREPDVAGEVIAALPYSHAILPGDHPLARAEAVRLAQLATTPLLLPDAELIPYPVGRIRDALAARGVRFAMSDFRLHGVPSAALATVADAWLLSFAGAESAPGTVARRIVDPPLAAEVWLLWRRDDASPVVRQFVESCLRWRRTAGADPAVLDRAVSPARPRRGD